jgi:hypothetical protein
MAALICGGVAFSDSAIRGSEVLMIEVSSPSMKKLAAMIRGTTSETFSFLGSEDSLPFGFSGALSSGGVAMAL